MFFDIDPNCHVPVACHFLWSLADIACNGAITHLSLFGICFLSFLSFHWACNVLQGWHKHGTSAQYWLRNCVCVCVRSWKHYGWFLLDQTGKDEKHISNLAVPVSLSGCVDGFWAVVNHYCKSGYLALWHTKAKYIFGPLYSKLILWLYL